MGCCVVHCFVHTLLVDRIASTWICVLTCVAGCGRGVRLISFSVCRKFSQLTWWWICRVFLVFFFRFPRTFFCCRCAYLTLYARGEPLSVHASRVVVRRKEACARGVFNPPLSSLGILTFLIQTFFCAQALWGCARRQFFGAPGRVWTSTPCCSCGRVA